MKKMLTLILAFAVLLSIIPFSALAVSAQTLTDEGYYLIGDMNDWKIDKDYRFQEYGSSSYRGIMFYGKDIQGDEPFQIVVERLHRLIDLRHVRAVGLLCFVGRNGRARPSGRFGRVKACRCRCR